MYISTVEDAVVRVKGEYCQISCNPKALLFKTSFYKERNRKSQIKDFYENYFSPLIVYFSAGHQPKVSQMIAE